MWHFTIALFFLAGLSVGAVTHTQHVVITPTTEDDHPVLPFHFNATLLKIGQETNAKPFWWTKLYYSYRPDLPGSGFNRYDFQNHYLNLDNEWSTVCSILFRDGVAYTIYPQENRCSLTHKKLPALSAHFLKGAVYNGTLHFRGVLAEKWRLGEVDDPDTIYYYASKDGRIPLRSTNQANDPGATDWFDVNVGEQDSALFQLPEVCSTGDRPIVQGCPPDQDDLSMESLVFQL